MFIKDFKITITAKKVPVNINNEIIEYIQDISLPNTHLQCKIFFKENLIAQGIVIDFYKEFEIIKDFNNNLFTHILTFNYNGKNYQSFTKFGQKIYEMKYLNNPPIEDIKREQYLNEIIFHFNGYLAYLKKRHSNLKITFIPSKSNIPEDLSDKLAVINYLSTKEIIKKKDSIESKNITKLSAHQFNKYFINLTNINTNNTFLVIDDVIGTTASLCEVMYKLYNFNKRINYFFVPVKDVKR